MRAPPYRWLAVLALAMTRAYAAGAEPAPGLVTDSGKQPVRGSSGECWRASPGASGMASACPGSSSGGGEPLAATARGGSGASSAPSAMAGPAAAQSLAPASARGNPGYLTDTNGIVVRGTRGECWHTGSWTPELATVVGCDGVLAKAVPVPAPAPSPKPQPPAESAAQPPVRAAEATPTPPPTSPSPPAVVPGQAAPATKPPAAAAPRSGRDAAPAVVPPAPPAPAPSAVAPLGEPAAPDAKRTEPASEKVTLDTDTYFDFDQATLKPDGRRKLDALAERLSAMQLEVVVATGHTDWTGTDAYNQRLSERRAMAVKRYLTGKGIAGDRIFTEGKGEKQPTTTNATRAGRAQNRRVEVEMVGTRAR